MSTTAATAWDFEAQTLTGKPAPLSAFRGKVALIVNTASQCGLTPQYRGLQALHDRFKDRGFVVLGFPSNQFGQQEPGTNEEIKTFCSRTYNVTFPIMSKVSVKGSDITPLYQFLTTNNGGDVKWNFTKFLVGKDGKPVQRFEPGVTPDSPEMAQAIEKALR